MLKHPRRPRDLSALAVQIGMEATGQLPKQRVFEASEMARRGAMGGKKGGKARAKALTAKRRTQIARRAARARWSS